MSYTSKTKNNFVIRGVDVRSIADCRGAIENQPSFNEIVATGLVSAVGAMLTAPATNSMFLGTSEVPVYGISFTLTRNRTSTNGRAVNSKVRSIVKSWAEKSRVRGTRGWRASAVSPAYGVTPSYGAKKTKFTVALGADVHYSATQAKGGTHDTYAAAATDMQMLADQLSRELPGEFAEMFFEHSVHGKGSLIV